MLAATCTQTCLYVASLIHTLDMPAFLLQLFNSNRHIFQLSLTVSVCAVGLYAGSTSMYTSLRHATPPRLMHTTLQRRFRLEICSMVNCHFARSLRKPDQ